ncbi:hypothetical protein CEUSTIGMA_g11970.t1 [Chlamydomonas eustigma]|uniref:Sulfotransferase n=1 Tax=Chlamydomonas eustigma TaxID=1157962 RepID=A0A250XNM9_9CHLO|nr:hypothetical protein CEUSTIGMA_g11970.t1 [Chlamydomonas eustigma]|eukprot:GAX84549.1 hypothetical protein CEUSTIGMA_g11970.t1 [Chlamydomonas eustigma]
MQVVNVHIVLLLFFQLPSSFGLSRTRSERLRALIFGEHVLAPLPPVDPLPSQAITTRTPIRRIAVIGERNSGTNFMFRFLTTNLDHTSYSFGDHFCQHKGCKPFNNSNPKHCYMRPQDGFETSEYLVSSFRNIAEHPYADALAVVMIRNPYDWAFSMHRNCWCYRRDIRALAPFEDIMTIEWRDNCPKPWLGEEVMGKCSSMMECRALKMINFFNMTKWAPNVEIVRHEDVISQEDSLAWLSRVADKYNLRMSTSYIQPVEKYKNWKRKRFDRDNTMATSPWFNSSVIENNATIKEYVMLINAKMNQAVESFAGYPQLLVKNIAPASSTVT